MGKFSPREIRDHDAARLEAWLPTVHRVDQAGGDFSKSTPALPGNAQQLGTRGLIQN
jgi:hypothetical protein